MSASCLNQFGLSDINCTGMGNDKVSDVYYTEFVDHFVTNLTVEMEYNPWICAALGSTLIGLSGILPLFIISVDDGINVKNGAGAHRLKVLLSFAVGGLLGDVFLHLLPEAWANDVKNNSHGRPSLFSGMMLLAGMLLFIVIEKLFSGVSSNDDSEDECLKTETHEKLNNNIHKPIYQTIEGDNIMKQNGLLKNGVNKNGFKNGVIQDPFKRDPTEVVKKPVRNSIKHISGYLNLMANSIDNFTHGLAVGGSFLISLRLGMFTTVAILIHEIPHEIGDFAILLKSGFSRWDAAKGQLLTASGGICGALVAVASSGGASAIENQTSWILPFTAGGFLHIALVTVLPDLIKEENSKESFKQFSALMLGILVMAAMTMLE